MSKKSLAYRAKRKLSRILKGKPAAKPGIDYNILLLTNRDSDNVGDQVIEATDISLIQAAMKNLGIEQGRFKINSREAAIVPLDYVRSRDEALLEKARKLIKKTDLVFFGGAPLFNYLYQIFYERTATTIEIAKEYGKPVVFSAVGVERYDENNPKCQRLKAALNLDNVKRITTRDGFDKLQQYKENPDLLIDKVADPAVFSSRVFSDLIEKSRADSAASAEGKKKIGVFIIRANAFTDNKIDFPWRKAADMWLGLADELEARGYDYEFITSGHFGDEAFLDRLIRSYQLPSAKCVFNVNCPEILMEHMAGYDAVISCRLHPSIISFSMGIPSISLVWNPKVRGFYESIGYPDRLIEAADLTPDKILDTVEKAMEGGVQHDKDYLMSVYRNIYCGLRDSLCIDDSGRTVYTYDELIANMPQYKGTTEKEKQLKLKRKFRRIYRTYNENFDKIESLKKELRELKAQQKA